MKKLFLLLPLTLLSVPVSAQQVNVYQVCTYHREVYSPGGYDEYGNYVRGGVYTQSYNAPCAPTSTVYAPAPRTCYAAPLGAILGGVGAYSATSKPNNRWWSVPLGVITGGIIGSASCN